MGRSFWGKNDYRRYLSASMSNHRILFNKKNKQANSSTIPDVKLPSDEFACPVSDPSLLQEMFVKMKVLLITDAYPPEIRSASHLMYDLANRLKAKGHSITVLTTFPQYNLTEDVKSQIQKYRLMADENGIRVIRIKTLPFHNVPHIVRGISELTLPILLSYGSRLAGTQDISIVYSPPLPLGFVAYLIKMVRGAPFVFNVQDLFPQNIIDLGIIRQPIIIKLFRGMENFIYRKADHITVHSPGNRRYLLSKGITPEKVSILHNWVDLDEFKADGIPNPVSKNREFYQKFIVFFGGVMGYAQDLETVVDCANLLRNEPHIYFLLLGDGAEKNALVQKSQSLGLNNIKFADFVSKEEFPRWVHASDVGLVTLKKSVKTPVVPSKILAYMAASRPVLASLNEESDGIRIVEEAHCGINVPAGDPSAMADAILKLSANREETRAMGQRGRLFAEKHFSIDACINQYEEIFKRLLKE